jgi:hypothetical protein
MVLGAMHAEQQLIRFRAEPMEPRSPRETLPVSALSGCLAQQGMCDANPELRRVGPDECGGGLCED